MENKKPDLLNILVKDILYLIVGLIIGIIAAYFF